MRMRKYFSFLLVLFASFFFVASFPCKKIDAIYYEESENKFISAEVSRSKNRAVVNIQYQNGITGLDVYICDGGITQPSVCKQDNNVITKFSDATLPVFNSSDKAQIYTATFNTPTEGKSIESYSDTYDTNGKVENKYTMAVYVKFCKQVQIKDGEYGCYVDEINYKSFTQTIYLDQGITSSNELNNTLATFLNIVNNIVIPIMWGGLGIFLLVKGILLGIGIVKSADEPDVRSKKVGGLVWLIIGVFVGYAVTILASYFMSMFGYGGYF